MKQAKIPELDARPAKAANRTPSTSRGANRLVALLLLLCAIFSISGCVGVSGKAASSSPQNQSTPAAAAVSVSPASITFGSVAVGGTVSQSITVSNSGGSNLSVINASTAASGVTITGASLPMTIVPGNQSTFNIVFSPKTVGTVSGTVSVMSNASSSPSSVTVSGSGVAATSLLNASTKSLSFGNVSAGSSSSMEVTLSNAGNSNITISNFNLAGTRFTTSGVSTGLILTPGQNATLNVIFFPLAAGSSTGTVTVTSNATNSPAVVSLSGTGVQTVSHSANLSWTASTSTVAGYNVYRSSVTGGPYTKMNSSIVAATQYSDSTVTAGQDYYYVVTSVTSGDVESIYSAQVSATVPIP